MVKKLFAPLLCLILLFGCSKEKPDGPVEVFVQKYNEYATTGDIVDVDTSEERVAFCEMTGNNYLYVFVQEEYIQDGVSGVSMLCSIDGDKDVFIENIIPICSALDDKLTDVDRNMIIEELGIKNQENYFDGYCKSVEIHDIEYEFSVLEHNDGGFVLTFDVTIWKS